METLLTLVGTMVASVLVGVAVSWWRGWRATRHRADLQQGGRATLRARLARTGDRSRAGRIWLSRGRAVWTSKRSAPALDLAGAQVLSSTTATGFHARPEDVVVRLQLPEGPPVELMLDVHDAALLTDALRELPATAPDAPPAAPPRGRRWWAYLLLAASGLWVGYCVSMFVTGYDATVTVVGGDGDGFCDVVWADTVGARHSGEAECDDEPAGSSFDVRVTGWPDPGEPTLPETYVGIALLFALPPAAVAGLRLRYLRGRRRAWNAAEAAAAATVRTSALLGTLTEEDLHLASGEQPRALLARLAPFAARQIPPDGWEDPRARNAIRRALRIGRRFLGPVWLLWTVAALSWPQPYHWYELTTGPTAIIGATSTGELVDEGWGPVAGLVSVEYRDASGRAARADIAADSPLPKGTDIDIEYSTSDLSAARLRGDGDALALGGIGGSVGLLAGLLWLLGTGFSVWRRHRMVASARTADLRPALGLLTGDDVGDPVVLAVDPLVAPLQFVAVPLQRPLPAGTAGRFEELATPSMTARGALRTGEFVILEVEGVTGPLVPSGPAVELPLDAVLDLIDSAGRLARATAGEDAREQSAEPTPS